MSDFEINTCDTLCYSVIRYSNPNMAEIARFSKNCSSCAFLLKLTCNYSPQCGTEILEDIEDANYNQRSVITEYFNKGYEYSTIVQLLEKEHDVTMSIRTLKCRLHEYGLKRRNIVYDEEFIRQRINGILDGSGCVAGYRSVWHTLKLEGLQVPRDIVEQTIRELGPEGCAERKARRLKFHLVPTFLGMLMNTTSSSLMVSLVQTNESKDGGPIFVEVDQPGG